MTNSVFTPIIALSSRITEIPIKSGNFILTSDTNQIYVDLDDSTRIPLMQSIVPVENLDVLSQIDKVNNTMYVVQDTTYVYVNHNLVELGGGSDPSLEADLDASLELLRQ